MLQKHHIFQNQGPHNEGFGKKGWTNILTKSKSPNFVVQVTYDKRKVNKGLVFSPFYLLNFLSYSTKTSRVEEREMKKDEKEQNYVNPQQRLFILLFLV